MVCEAGWMDVLSVLLENNCDIEAKTRVWDLLIHLLDCIYLETLDTVAHRLCEGSL